MEKQYLIPANTKSSLLIFNVFRPFDIMLFGAGAFVSFILLFAIPGDSIVALIIKLAPVAVTGLLVMPVPYYQNVLVFLTEIFYYFMNRRIYLWKGWCIRYGEKE